MNDHNILPLERESQGNISYKNVLTLSGPRFFRYRKERGGGRRGVGIPPPPLWFFWKLVGRILYMHICYHMFWGCSAWKRHQNLPFFKRAKSHILIFQYFSKIPSEINSTQPKVRKSKEISGMGHLEIFWVKGKNRRGGVDSTPPPPVLKGVRIIKRENLTFGLFCRHWKRPNMKLL